MLESGNCNEETKRQVTTLCLDETLTCKNFFLLDKMNSTADKLIANEILFIVLVKYLHLFFFNRFFPLELA